MRGLILAGMLAVTGCGQAPADRAITQMRQQTERLRATIAETDYLVGKTTPQGGWAVAEGKSAMTDAPSYSVSTRSQDYAGPYGKTAATLHVRCDEKATAVFIDWDEYLGLRTADVQYRIDDAPAKTASLTISTNNKAAGWWEGRSAIPIIRKLVTGAKLIARVTPYGENQREAMFAIEGLGTHAEKIAEACGWSMVPAAKPAPQAEPSMSDLRKQSISGADTPE
jgi:type VI secretion system protein VasI